MSLYDALYPYFSTPQPWHLYAGLGFFGFLAFWQVEKWKIDRETSGERWFQQESKKYMAQKAKEEAEQAKLEKDLENKKN